MGQEHIYLIPLLPLLGAFINLVFGRFLGRSAVHTIAIGVVLASCVTAGWIIVDQLIYGDARATGLTQSLFTWIEVPILAQTLKIELAFTVDTLSAVMLMVITFVGTLIHVFSTGYMSHEPRYAAYFGYLNLFTGAMLILVLADNLPVMFIGWEGVGLCSYLLIGFWFSEEANANAGRKAFVVNRIGDFAFLLGMFLLFTQVGTLSFGELQGPEAVDQFRQGLWGERTAFFIGLLLFIGACGKSAQIPLYVWLPDAMAGPTPVSALIHAATMVTAGVYLVARMSWLYASSTTVMMVVAVVGALTALFAAIMAFAQTDFKKVLAYSTVSQLGFMFVAVGVGAYAAGIFHLVTHAFFKAGLFLSAGSVMHAMSGSGDITKMGGLRRKLPWTHGCFLVYWLAICGIFPFAGFFSKDEILAGAFFAQADTWPPALSYVLWGTLTLAAVGTAFYMSRLYFLVFSGDCRADAETKKHIHESPVSMVFPLVVLAAFTAVIGFVGLPHIWGMHEWPGQIGNWLEPAVAKVYEVSYLASGLEIPEEPHHGVGLVLGLIAVALTGGIAGIAGAAFLYRNGPSPWVARFTEAGVGKVLYDLSYNKFYVDEVYGVLFVRPFRWLARATFEFVDRFVIDLIFVNGSARVVDVAGRLARWFQNGQVQRYMVGLVIGAAVIFYVTRSRGPDFDYTLLDDGRVQFQADVSDGPEGVGAVVYWDFDTDGKPDRDPAYVARPGDPEDAGLLTDPSPVRPREGLPHKVTMWIKDGVYEETQKVTKRIQLGDERENASPPVGGAR